MCQMKLPQVRYYARMVLATPKGNKTPKYKVEEVCGYYPPMDTLKGRDGNIYFYLSEKLKDGVNVPSMRLQSCKNGLNFTGLKDYFVDGGKLSGVAYGYPSDKETFGDKKKKPNPFFDYKDDGYLFLIKTEANNVLPSEIELLVLDSAKPMISAYCKMLLMGGFDEVLVNLRKVL